MRSLDPQSTPKAFDLAFHEWFALGEEPPNTEAEFSGPWRVEPMPTGWGCFAEGESESDAVLTDRHVALLAAAALPPSGMADRFSLEDQPEPPFPILDRGKAGGTSAWFNQEFIAGLNVLAAVIASPSGLAFVLEAAGATTVERAAKILAQRLRRRGAR